MKSALQKLSICMFSVICLVFVFSITTLAEESKTYTGVIYDYTYNYSEGQVSSVRHYLTYESTFDPDIYVYSDALSPTTYSFHFCYNPLKSGSLKPTDKVDYVSYTVTNYRSGSSTIKDSKGSSSGSSISVTADGTTYKYFFGGGSATKDSYDSSYPVYSSVPPYNDEIFDGVNNTYEATHILHYVYVICGGNGSGADDPPYSDDLAVADKSLGYLQNVVYKEENRAADGRYGTISWNPNQADWGSDYRIQIMTDNFYTQWFNKTTKEYTTYKVYDDNIAYTSGEFTFFSQEPVRSWMDDRGYDYTNALKYQTYGTTAYYVRVVKYDKSDGKFHCGGWVKIDIKRSNSTQLPWTETETGGFDEGTGGWVTDNESDDSYKYQTGSDGTVTMPWDGNLDDINLNAFTWFWRNMKNMIEGMGQFPAFISHMFGFLPSFIPVTLGGFFIVLVILRFLGR